MAKTNVTYSFLTKQHKLNTTAKKAIDDWTGANKDVHKALQTIAQKNEALCKAGIIGKSALVYALATAGIWPVEEKKPVSYGKCKDGKLVDELLLAGVNRFASWCSANGKTNGKNKGSGRKAGEKVEGAGSDAQTGKQAVTVSKKSVLDFLKRQPKEYHAMFEAIATAIQEETAEQQQGKVASLVADAAEALDAMFEHKAVKDAISTISK